MQQKKSKKKKLLKKKNPNNISEKEKLVKLGIFEDDKEDIENFYNYNT